MQPGSPTGFEGFNPEELGVEHVKTLYDFIEKNRTPRSPELLVVDSADLVANPEGMVRRMCERCALTLTSSIAESDTEPVSSIGAHFDPEMCTSCPQRSRRGTDASRFCSAMEARLSKEL